MTKITIHKADNWLFDFQIDRRDTEITSTPRESCEYCHCVTLDKVYVYIINCLREAGLLPEDYKLICCYCKVLIEFGLRDLQSHLNSIQYFASINVLRIKFNFFGTESFTFDVYDFKKLIET